jgi:hypothetical protein
MRDRINLAIEWNTSKFLVEIVTLVSSVNSIGSEREVSVI